MPLAQQPLYTSSDDAQVSRAKTIEEPKVKAAIPETIAHSFADGLDHAPPRLLAQTPPTLPGLQSDPNPDLDNDFGQPTPDVTPIDANEEPALDSPDSDGIGTDSSGTTILGSTEPRPDTVRVNQFEWIDRDGAPLTSRYLTESAIERQIGNLRGRYFSITELQAIADQITQFYLDGDYITSRAILPEQSVINDTVRIQVIEGRLSAIEVEGENRLREDYIRHRIELGATTPLNTTELENQLRLLRSNPLFETVEASLRAGTELGESILVVRVTEANPWTASIQADNYAPPSVGSERIGISLGHRNVVGFGDEFSAEYNFTTTDGLDFGNISYRVPINAMNGAIQFRASPNRNSITQEPFDAFGINGDSSTYELTYRQPIVRTPREELAFSLGFSFQNSQTFIEDEPTPFGIGPDEKGRSRTRTLSFGQDYVRRDTSGAWAFRSQFRLGTALFHATENSGDVPDGQFLSWLGQVQRVQRLSDDHLLIAQVYTQFSGEPLLPSQQFVIGGGQSVRGFRQNARSGDNGIRLSIEDRIAVIRNTAGLPVLQLAPFLDLGYVWNDSDNPNTETDQRFLAGLGLGVAWQPFENFSIRLDYGVPLVDLADRGKNIQDDGLYFSVGYGF
ncbi:MAG: ShlB/FhaC/HecB family hemolysin secretion/activation protein [Oscillatoriales cyanobacterium]|nr:MAG: ShlB/FhaC/HecB family hemolysin secretion/activation protein [Oscillatoriales cyanobacterium]